MKAAPIAETRQLVRFKTCVPVTKFVQKTAFKYRLKSSAYVFEIAKYQEFATPNAVPVSPAKSASETTTAWGASFFNEGWDAILGPNAHLGIGEAGRWSPSLNTFFPRDVRSLATGPASGFREFLVEVGKVAQLLEVRHD